ncbi:methyl-accepting chemotaxis protein [Rhodoferax ferrireducens]|uniref:methyl-accepting chemotaxis protein n=1 Tax=Rhodoferax ferrireducens TaxID=192843 RepID=UPI000E0D5D0A|nr:methyl-accepting chemotaxis protein [Rhodoferax ferrireducens]
MLFNTLRSLSLATRLTVGFSSILLLLVTVAATGAYSVRTLGQHVQTLVQVNNVKTELANDLMSSIDNLAIQTRSVALFANLETDLDGKQAAAEVTLAQAAEERYLRTEARLAALLAASHASDAERGLLAEVAAAAKVALPAIRAAVQQGSNRETEAAVLTLVNQVRPEESRMRHKVEELVVLQRKLTEADNAAMAALERKTQMIAVTLVVFALVLGGAIGWGITRSVTQPIGRAVVVAERIAKGDLTSEIEVRIHDETGRLLEAIRAMQERLRTLVGGIRQAADSIQMASSEVAMGNQDLSQRTEQAASSLQQTAQSMDHLTSIVMHGADSAKQANQLASTAAAVAARGGSVVAEVVTTMDEINASSKRISDIIGVIDGIAFQTNILALNAAVEAARAGEQGRGFAVVASEVRSLAGRSAEAAREIKGLIGASVERVERGARLVNDAGSTMKDIVGSVKKVNDTIGEITAAASNQSAGISQINASIAALDQMTQQNSALVEESAAAAESLREQAARLAEVVSTFKLDRLADASVEQSNRQLARRDVKRLPAQG